MVGWVVFTIAGERINPDVISHELSLTPDRVIYPQPSNRYKTVWQLNSLLPSDESIERHIWNILARLLPVRNRLKKYQQDAELEFYCSVKKNHNASDVLMFSPRLLLLAGSLGAGITTDFDVILPETKSIVET